MVSVWLHARARRETSCNAFSLASTQPDAHRICSALEQALCLLQQLGFAYLPVLGRCFVHDLLPQEGALAHEPYLMLRLPSI
jgi:hypothetical protein